VFELTPDDAKAFADGAQQSQPSGSERADQQQTMARRIGSPARVADSRITGLRVAPLVHPPGSGAA